MDKLTEVNQGSQYRKFKYDSLGRMLFEKIPEMTATLNDGTGTYWTTKYVYTDFNAVSTKTDARGVVNTYSYDSANRMTGVSYNVSGATGVVSTPSVSYSYDTGATSATKGLPLSVSLSGQSSESYSYDSDNQLSGVTRTIGSKTYTTSYQRTTAGQLTQLTYASNRVLNLNHDATGRLSSIVNNGDSSNYLSGLSYNYAGQMTGWTLGSNIAETLGYDSNRLQLTSQTVTQNGSTRMSLSYNYAATAGQNGTGSTAGNSGQLMSISGSLGGSTELADYTYDLSGRLVTSNQTTNSVSAQQRFEYDRWGNRTGVWDATTGGNPIQRIDLEQSSSIPTNRLQTVHSQATNVAAASNGATASASSTLSSSYPASGAIDGDHKGSNWGNGGVWNDKTAWANPDWLQVNFSGSKTISEIDVYSLQDNYSSPSEPTEAMTFNDYGLTNFEVQYWNDTSWVTVSGGSVSGNDKVWRKFTFASVTTDKIRVYITGAADGYSRVAEIEAYESYTYDSNGNVTDDGAHSYQYDAENRLVNVDSGATASYAYDHQNRRIKKVVGSTTTHYVWEGGQCIAEHNGSTGAVVTDYIYSGGRMIAREQSGNRHFFLYDRLSARATITDGQGGIIGRQATLPFGEELNTSGTTDKHRFTSYERDTETGNDYAVNRGYRASIGRFNQADPYKASGGAADPQSWNRYTYVGNDPANYVDPAGLWAQVPPPPVPPPPPEHPSGIDQFVPISPNESPSSDSESSTAGVDNLAEIMRVIWAAVWDARQALESTNRSEAQRKACADAITGTSTGMSPQELVKLLEKLVDSTIKPGNALGGIASTTISTDATAPGLFENATITIGHKFLWDNVGGLTKTFGLKKEQAQALAILHELGHAVGNAWAYLDKRNEDNIAYSRRIVDACLK